MTITDQKKNLRKQMLLQRAKLSKPTKKKYDLWICQSLLKIIKDRDYKTIHCYIPMGSEIDISPLIENLLDKKLKIVTPKTLPKRKLQHLVLNSLDELEKGVFGTAYPKRKEVFLGKYDLIIVPGLAFDSDNYRIGYGGGYYDNFIVNHPLSCKVGIFYPFQEVEKIPYESHDIKLDEVLFDKAFFDF